MPIDILMPALSPTMTEGKLAKWHKKEGDTVKAGDVLAEIETDKATMEVEAVDEGTIGKILVPEGTQGVKVNAPIAVLLGEGEDTTALAGEAGGEAAAPQRRAPRPLPAAARQQAPPPPPPADGRRPAAQQRAGAAPQPAPPRNGARRRRARLRQPAGAAHRASRRGSILPRITGSGPAWPHRQGRCRRRAQGRRARAPPRPRRARAGGAAGAALARRAAARTRSRRSPATRPIPRCRITAMRNAIAQRLTESKRRSRITT